MLCLVRRVRPDFRRRKSDKNSTMDRSNFLDKVGNTPLVSVTVDGMPNVNLYAKLEGGNPTGSVKDRAASYILQKLLSRGVINLETTIIESTSGNFGVALSAFCRYHGLRFIAVVDPNITSMNEMLIVANGGELVKVTKPDRHGGYLLSRIEKIHELEQQMPNSYWVNQYENPLNALAYYHSLGKEICFQVEDLHYVFLGVSSGGTITGVSRKIRENFRDARIIAVDVEGSVIFNNPSGKRFIPGIGSSMVPRILEDAYIDEVILTNETATIEACHELLEKQSIFVGGSSGSVLAGVRAYFSKHVPERPVTVVTVFPDRGERYFDTIYNTEWCNMVSEYKKEQVRMPMY